MDADSATVACAAVIITIVALIVIASMLYCVFYRPNKQYTITAIESGAAIKSILDGYTYALLDDPKCDTFAKKMKKFREIYEKRTGHEFPFNLNADIQFVREKRNAAAHAKCGGAQLSEKEAAILERCTENAKTGLNQAINVMGTHRDHKNNDHKEVRNSSSLDWRADAKSNDNNPGNQANYKNKNYKTVLCWFWPNCPDGDGCQYAHGKDELRCMCPNGKCNKHS